jgi:hypothetical protein
MSNELDPKTDPDQPMVYQIRLQGHLSRRWKDCFGDVTITLEDNGETLLTCPVADQAALYGLLRKVRDLGLPLISVTHVKSGQADGSDVEPQIAPSYLETDKQDDFN